MLSLRRVAFFALIASVLLTTPLAVGQQVFGSIFGTVTDTTGAAIAGARVVITDQNKGTKSEVTTDASGNYTKGQLIPDTYKVEVEVKGFQRVISNGIEVRVDESARYDAALKVGDVSTEVEVTATAPLLQSDRADVAQTLTTKEVNELPNLGRNAQSYELLNPGTAKIGWQHASDENPQGSIQLIANGLLFDQIGYELDGTTNQDPILGIIIINPTFDSIGELKQANQNFDAEFSYVGAGLISYSTKSGTNEFHGDAFEYLQLNTPGFTSFAANPFTGLPAALYRQNQFGGAIGGPILKNKLFFFGDAQINRESQGASVVTSVPDALNRTGNFSDWLAANPAAVIYDPTTGNPTTGLGRTPFANNTIPTNRLSPQALAILQNFPAPNFQQIGNEPYLNNYAANGDIGISGESWNTREDYYLNDKNSIFGRFSQAHFIEQGPGVFGNAAGGVAFGNYAGDSQSTDRSLAIGWTRTISPTLINEFRFGYSRYHVFDVPNGYGTQPATAAGIPGLNLDNTYTSGLPYFDIGNITNNGGYNDSLKPYQLGYALGVNQCNCPLTQTENNYQFIDNVSKSLGNHTFKFGADIRFATNLRVPSDSHRAGELTFNGTDVGFISAAGAGATPGIGLATFLLGDVSSFQRYVSSSTNASERQKRFYWYGQDQWRPTPKLTVTLGLRWEMVFPETVNAAGNGATFNLSNGLVYVFGEGGVSSHGIQSMNWHEFAPRAGVAYQLNPKTVIRAGYGWSYDLGVFGSNFGHNVTQNPPVLANQSVQPINNFTDVFTLASGPPTLAPITVGANGTFPLPAGINPKFRPATLTMPTVYQYNIAIQYQVSSKIAVTGAYVGNSQRHGLLGNTGNTTNPNEAIFVPGVSNTNLDRPYYSTLGIAGDLSYYCNCSNSHYDSFQGTVKINALQGWTVQASYTYQTQAGEGFSPYDNNYYFYYDYKDGYGNGGLLPHNQITIAQTYALPFGRGQKYGSSINRYADLALGGWQISGIMTYYSGFPFSPTLENYPGKPNTGPNNRPDLGTGSPYAGALGGREQWFVGGVGGAFLLPASGTFGTYPINTLIGPQFIQQDIALAKTFKLTERVGFILRADAFNSFNHTNLGLPNADIQSSSVGQITSLAPGGSMRRMQFSGTIKF
jgi:hypothetical protein